MIGIYLGACKAYHEGYDIVYQDIDDTRDIGGDMLDVDLSPFDFIICTPPCNYWSRLNCEYWRSEYALRTLHLLPIMLIRLAKLRKPFIIENVINKKRMSTMRIFDILDTYHIIYIEHGRHAYFTNVSSFDPSACEQHFDFKSSNGKVRCINNDGYSQGGSNVRIVIDKWLKDISL